MVRTAPPLVQLPKQGADNPAWAKVGVIALLGFVCGFAWPHFTGTRLAPSLPGDAVAKGADSSSSATAADKPSPEVDKAAASAAHAAAGGASTPPGLRSDMGAGGAAAKGSSEWAVNVGPGLIHRCRDGDDEPLRDCGSLQFDTVAVPVLKGLAQCGPGKAAPGHLSIGFDIDFRRHRARSILGRSSAMPADSAQALANCVDTAMRNANFGDIKHRHQRYTVYYNVTLSRPGEPTPPGAPLPAESTSAAGTTTTAETPASGNATVAWDVAVIRETPRTGAIVGRVVRGTKVRVVARQGDWYRVHTGAIEGWAYRGSLGM